MTIISQLPKMLSFPILS